MNQQQHEVEMVTRASAGVGSATVRAFASQGARTGLLACGEDGLEAASHEVEAADGEALVIAGRRGRCGPG